MLTSNYLLFRSLAKILNIALFCLLLSSCSDDEYSCLTQQDVEQVSSPRISPSKNLIFSKVVDHEDLTNGFYNTEIYLKPGLKYTIEVEGMMFLSPVKEKRFTLKTNNRNNKHEFDIKAGNFILISQGDGPAAQKFYYDPGAENFNFIDYTTNYGNQKYCPDDPPCVVPPGRLVSFTYKKQGSSEYHDQIYNQDGSMIKFFTSNESLFDKDGKIIFGLSSKVKNNINDYFNSQSFTLTIVNKANRIDQNGGDYDQKAGKYIFYPFAVNPYEFQNLNSEAVKGILGGSEATANARLKINTTNPQTFSGEVINKNKQISKKDAGQLWFRLNDTYDGKFNNNHGEYEIKIFSHIGGSETITPSSWSKIIYKVRDLIRNDLLARDGAVAKIFNGITCVGSNCQDFRFFIFMMLTLYIAGFGLGYLAGMIQFTAIETMVRMVKVAFVAALIKPEIWNFFYDYFFVLFSEGTDWLLSNLSSCKLGEPFCFIDEFVNYITSSVTWRRLTALFFFSWMGKVILLVVAYSCYQFFIAILKAFLAYILAILIVSLLIIVGPIFISFLLFQKTKDKFDQWVKFLLFYTIEPALAVFSVAFIVYIYTRLLNNVLVFNVCWKCAMPISTSFTGQIACIPSYLPQGSEPFTESPYAPVQTIADLGVDLTTLLLLVMLAQLANPLMSHIRSFLLVWIVNIRTSQSFLPGGGGGKTDELMAQALNPAFLIGRDQGSISRRLQKARNFYSKTKSPESTDAPPSPAAENKGSTPPAPVGKQTNEPGITQTNPNQNERDQATSSPKSDDQSITSRDQGASGGIHQGSEAPEKTTPRKGPDSDRGKK